MRAETRPGYSKRSRYEDTDEKSGELRPPRQGDVITSRKNSFVRKLVQLREKSKTRQELNAVLIVGEISIREILELSQQRQEAVAWNDTDQSKLLQGHVRKRLGSQLRILVTLSGSDACTQLSKFALHHVEVTADVMRMLAGVETSDATRAVAVFDLPATCSDFSRYDSSIPREPDAASARDEGDDDAAGYGSEHGSHATSLLTPELQQWCHGGTRVLALDGVQDPGNVGTLLRTCAAFGWDGVFLLPGCCDPFNKKVVRACKGALFSLHIGQGHWSHLKAWTSANCMRMYAAAAAAAACLSHDGNSGTSSQEGSSWTDSRSSTGTSASPRRSRSEGAEHDQVQRTFAASREPKLCLVLGSEGSGVSEPVRRMCQGRVWLHMPGHMESLNVGVAGGILLFILKPDTCAEITLSSNSHI